MRLVPVTEISQIHADSDKDIKEATAFNNIKC